MKITYNFRKIIELTMLDLFDANIIDKVDKSGR